MPNNKMPFGLKILLGFIGLCILVYLLLTYVYRLPQYQSSPEIGRNLPSNPDLANAEFLNRVQKAFPNGTLGEKIKNELSRQGFQIRWETDKKRFVADFRVPGFPCDKGWYVSWQNQVDGTAENVSGFYQYSCL